MEQTSFVAGQPSRNRNNGQVILVVLLITLPLLALLVVQQGRVIEMQRLLIQQLNSDSQQLNAIRVRELQNRQAHPPANAPQADTQPQPDKKQQPGAAPQQKPPKRHPSKQAPAPPAQEYPGSRPVPVRKSV